MSRSKGNRTIRRAMDFYEQKDRDWKIGRVERTAKWVKQKDLFGLFDLLAIAPGGWVHLIQAKTNRPATQGPLREFATEYASTRVRVLCMTWYDYKGWRIQRYCKNGSIKETDLRS